MKTETFVKRSRFNVPVAELFKWHARPGALERLSPPWDPLELVHKQGGIKKGARAIMKITAAPLPLKIKWIAEHTHYEENRMFRDHQVKGPFARWVHTHNFTPHGNTACFLEDHISYALLFPPFGNFLGGRMIQNKLEQIFEFRHKTTAFDLEDHGLAKDKKPLTILISGGSGLVGKALEPYLTTGGHRVVKLVRRKPFPEKNEVFWDPLKGELDLDPGKKIDAVVHLSGENIGQGRWTDEKKKRIIESRNKSTSLLARAVTRMAKPPAVFISASAIGYYGNRGDECMTEEDTCGPDFISDVCSQWESSASLACETGIRTVFLRIGIALSPLGGALGKMLPSFNMGLGGMIGNGKQYMSWVHMDDVIGAIYHCIMKPDIEGPVNVVSPAPETNARFTRILGKVMHRPAGFPIPESVIKLMFGEMGKEIPLSSTRVMPKRLMDTGYRFRYLELEDALRSMLGKMKPT